MFDRLGVSKALSSNARMLPIYSFGWKMVTHSRLCVSLSAKFDRLVQDGDLTQSGGDRLRE